MAVVENTTSASGDILYIKTDIPTIGLLALLSYTDSLTGESGTLSFKREFSFSFDDIIWSNWQDLTNDNIVNVDVQPNKPLYLKYRYTRQGSDNASIATWENTEVQGTLQNEATDEGDTYFNISDFKCFFDKSNLDLLKWYLNVTEKIYRQNLLPEYIDRAFSDNFEDRDFIDFWLSIAKFFSYYVILARKITKISDNNSRCENLLLEYLRQWGLYLCGDETNEELNNIRKTLYNEFAKRGTYNIVKRETTEIRDYTGEFLRLICFDDGDEFIYALYKPNHFSWNMDNASPMFRGLFFHINANKFYEKTQFKDLYKYPIINSNNASIVTEGDKKVLRFIYPNDTDENGFDFSGVDKLIPIDPFLSYECSFLIRSTDEIHFDFGIKAYKANKAADTITNVIGSSDLDYALFDKYITNFPNSKYKLVRLFIYGFNQTGTVNNDQINGASNYRFKTTNKYIQPFLKIRVIDTNQQVFISDFRLTPAFTEYERSLLGVKNFVSIWLRNNSENDKDTIEQVLKHYLNPYNIVPKLTFLNDLQENVEPPPPDETEFKIKLYFDWSSIVNDADYILDLKMYENGLLKPILHYPLDVDNGTSAPDAEVTIINGRQYNLLLKHNYTADLEYSFNNSSWTYLSSAQFFAILNFVCFADVNIYVRRRSTYNHQINVDNVSIAEGGLATFTLTRTGDTGIGTVVSIETENGTAIAGTNYNAIVGGSVSFGVGETQKFVQVQTLDDGVVTGNLQYKLKLLSATNGATISTPFGTGTIQNTDVGATLLKVKKETWQGYAKAELTDSTGTYDIQNNNTFASTVQGTIFPGSYSLKVYAVASPPVVSGDPNPDVDAFEVTCQGETKLIIGKNGNVSFSLNKSPIAGEILVSFRKLQWRGQEQTASCFCSSSCVYQYETVRGFGINLSFDVRYKVFDGVNFVQVKQHVGTNNDLFQSKISDLGGSFKVLISASSSTGKKIRIAFWGTSGVLFLEQDFQTSVVDLEFNSVTPNIYVQIEELPF